MQQDMHSILPPASFPNHSRLVAAADFETRCIYVRWVCVTFALLTVDDCNHYPSTSV
jgi:hypothetical protein